MSFLKKLPFFVLTFLSGLLSGVDTTVSGGMLSLPAFLNLFFPRQYQEEQMLLVRNKFCEYSSNSMAALSFIPYGLGLTVGFFTIPLLWKFGLRRLMIASTVLVAFGGGLSILLLGSFTSFLIGRIILGVGLAVFRQVLPKYLGEVPPRECRDWIDIIYDLSSTLGTLLGSILIFSEFGNSNAQVWRTVSYPAIVIAGILCLLSFLLPESPMFLIFCRNEVMARQSLERILNPDEVQAELVRVGEEADELRGVNPLSEIFKRSSLPHLLIHIPSFIFRSFMGSSTLLLFLPVFIIGTGIGKNESVLASVFTCLTSFVIGLISAVLIERFQFGRRRIILVGCVTVVLTQFFLGLMLHIYMKPGHDIDHTVGIMVVIGMCILVTGSTLVANPLGWLSQSYPRTAHSVGSIFSRNMNPTVDFIVCMWFVHLLCSIEAGVFFICMAVSLLQLPFVYYFVPESVPDVEMAQQWGDHWFWSRFVEDEHV